MSGALAHLEVTPARLATAADNIGAAGQAIDLRVAEMSMAATALSAHWSGEARDAFVAAQAQLEQSLESRTALLALMNTALHDLAGAYSDADLQGARGLGVAE